MMHTYGRWLPAVLVALAAGVLAPGMASGKAESSSASMTNVEKGKMLAFDRRMGNCLACHEIAGGKLTGNVGPELVDMKQRYPDRDVLFQRVWDETQFNPQTVMPPFGRNNILTKQQVNYIVDFLYTR